MSKVFVTGDVHGKLDIGKNYNRHFKEAASLTKDDILIIAGDAGIIWAGFNKKHGIMDRDKRLIGIYDRRPYMTAFVDGNHENHQALNEYPVEMWNGGKIHRISPSVVHLMRGECYEISGKKFFVMGGADSVDKIWRQTDFMLTGMVSWWPEEMPSKEEYDRARATIKANNNRFDYIITHCASSMIQSKIDDSFKKDELTDFFNEVEAVSFDKWFFGHYHKDVQVDEKHICLYHEIMRII